MPNAISNSKDYPAALPAHQPVMLLVVEDNPGDVNLVDIALKHYGMSPLLIVASDGDEAFVLIDKIDSDILPCPDLIVLDIHLPKRNGFEVLQKVRGSRQCKTSPVVMFSSSDAQNDQAEAFHLGATCYIRKPNSLTEIKGIGKRLMDLLPGRDRSNAN